MKRTPLALFLVVCSWSSFVQAGTPFHDPIFGVTAAVDVLYGTGATQGGAGTKDLLLDLLRPEDIGLGALPARVPGIVLIHGGYFTGGSKADLDLTALAFAQLGYVAVSIDYRLFGDDAPLEPGPAAGLIPPPPPYATLPFPQAIRTVNAAVQDGMKAIAWMRDHADELGVDPNRIAVGGYSAGAITSLLLGYSNPPAHSAPQAVLSLAGGMYGVESIIAPGGPPAIILHGNADTVVPYSGAQAVVNRLNAAGIYNEFYTVAGGDHGLDMSEIVNGASLEDHTKDFLIRVLVPEPSSIGLASMAGAALLLTIRRRRVTVNDLT